MGAIALAALLLPGCSDDTVDNSTSTQTVYTQYLYNVNRTAGTVTEFLQHTDTGYLTAGAASSPYAVGTNPRDFAFNPAGTVAFVDNQGSNTITEFLINSADGSLTNNGTVASAGTAPTGGVVDPRGLFYFTADTTTVSAYVIDQTTGKLVSSSTTPIAATPYRVAVDYTGQFLYVTTSAGLYSYSINQTSGALTVNPSSPFSATHYNLDSYLAVDYNGHLFVTNPSGQIEAYTLTNTGTMTAAGTTNTASTLGTLFFEPNHNELFVAEQSAGAVGAYTITPATGALTPVTNSPFASGLGTYGVTAEPQGTYLYTTNFGSNTVTGFFINSAGQLAPGTPFATGVGPTNVRIVQFSRTQTLDANGNVINN